MRKKVSLILKNQVAQRANFRCEYCLIPEKTSFFTFHIDHIVSIKHNGTSKIDNLAYCCPDCNNAKGSDVGSFFSNDIIVRFYNPRKNTWHEHFEMSDGIINGKTEIGSVTARIFKFNDLERLIFRQNLIELNQYL